MPAQGLGFLRLSLSRIQILVHWKKPLKRSLILANKSESLDVWIRPNWEGKKRRRTSGRWGGRGRCDPRGVVPHGSQQGERVTKPGDALGTVPFWAPPYRGGHLVAEELDHGLLLLEEDKALAPTHRLWGSRGGDTGKTRPRRPLTLPTPRASVSPLAAPWFPVGDGSGQPRGTKSHPEPAALAGGGGHARSPARGLLDSEAQLLPLP